MNPLNGVRWMAAFLVASTLACSTETADAPPEVRYGESVCAACNMILSDERFATATMVEADRGPEPRLFDDFNCQFNFEKSNPTQTVVARWVHDHETRGWVRAESATYVKSSELRTPMGSGIAAFGTPEAANAFAAGVSGSVLSFDEVRSP